MAQATALAAGTTAANSADIVVTTPVTISLFSGETDQHMNRVKCTIYQKDVNGNYFVYTTNTDLFQTRNTPLLTNTQRTFLMNEPGTYRVQRPACVSSVGVQTDTQA